jgi:sec-independent protein translocase protein TatB
MSFSDTVFLFFLALILFGPKKLPEMARQAGKLLAELRRASNEFRSQIETEISHLEVEKTRTVLPPSPPPQGTVASLHASPAENDPVPRRIEATSLEVFSAPAASPPTTPADPKPPASTESASLVDTVGESHVETVQEPHV